MDVVARREEGVEVAGVQPPAETKLAEGDVVMAIGTARTLERLEELFQSSQATLT